MKRLILTFVFFIGTFSAVNAQGFIFQTNLPAVHLTAMAPDLLYADGFQVADAKSIMNWANNTFVPLSQLATNNLVLGGAYGGSGFTNSAAVSFGYNFISVPFVSLTTTNSIVNTTASAVTTSNCIANFPGGTNVGGNFIVTGPP